MRISKTPVGLHLFLLCVPLVLTGCGESSTEPATPPPAEDAAAMDTAPAASEPAPRPPNFIVILGDDMGVETLAMYGIGESPAVTPNLDRLAAEGMVFEQFWTQPICSPTRAAVLTGQFGFRNGVLNPILPRPDLLGVEVPELPEDAFPELDMNPRTGAMDVPATPLSVPSYVTPGSPAVGGLPADAVTLPQTLKALPAGYATAAVGKWHLADSSNGWLDHPNVAGFDHYSGHLLGIAYSHQRWPHTENGVVSGVTGYLDRRTTEEGIAWLEARSGSDQPWFLWVAYGNAHEPVHMPPRDLLHSERSLALDTADMGHRQHNPVCHGPDRGNGHADRTAA